jgi:uncharacterized membrane protein YphA (DoxX/SURF4 family)
METARWHLGTKIAFRFAFIYFLLYTLYVPLHLFPIPPVPQISDKYYSLWNAIVPWVTNRLLHLQYDFSRGSLNTAAGSKDTMHAYIEALCYLVIAAVATIVWSLLDRNRPNYAPMHRWFMVYLRLVLAATMIPYGATKVFPWQFPAPSLSKLLETYGDSSPMGLLWTFMGASRSYSFFGGATELVAGMLLVIPRLATLGGLVCIGVMSNVLMLNLGYDVPVKLGSIHLLLMAGFVVAPDLRRLADFFVLNRRVEPAVARPLFRSKWLNRSAVALQVAFGVVLLSYNLYQSDRRAKQVVEFREQAPLYGIWSVDEFKVDGNAGATSLTEQPGWQRIVIESFADGMVKPVRGPEQHFLLHFDPQRKAFSMTTPADPGWIAEFTYENPQPDLLVLTGKMGGHPTSATLHKEDESKFLLKSRGFHWIQDLAVNR